LYNPVKLSPVYMCGCMKSCNKIQPSEIKSDDKAINYCLEFGFCGETLSNICKIANDKNQDIKHPLLKQYCSLKTTHLQNKPNKKSLKETQKVQQEKLMDDPSKQAYMDYSNNMGVIMIIMSIVLLSLFMLYKKDKF